MAEGISKTRFAQMLANEQERQGLTDREICKRRGWLQQTYSKWKHGSLPRQDNFAEIANFLKISTDMVSELVEEAKDSVGNTKIPRLGVFDATITHGKVSDRKEGKYKFAPSKKHTHTQFAPQGRYSLPIDTKVMEPAFLVGTRAWADPSIWPAVGNDVVVHSKGGVAWIGRLESLNDQQAEISQYANDQKIVVKDVSAVHVIVLAERVAEKA